MSQNKFHYCYMSTDGEKYYVGVRSSNKQPSQDEYFGSFKDKNFHPNKKIILSIHFSRRIAIKAEIFWQRYYNVVEDEKFINRAYQTSAGFYFDRSNIKATEETRIKMSNSKKKWMNENPEKWQANKEKMRVATVKRNLINNPNKGKFGVESGYSDKNIYLFQNKNGETFLGNRYDFSNFSNLTSRQIKPLFYRPGYCHKWIATCPIT